MDLVQVLLMVKKCAYAVGDSADTFREGFAEELAMFNGSQPEQRPEPEPEPQPAQPEQKQEQDQQSINEFWLTRKYNNAYQTDDNQILAPNSKGWRHYLSVMKLARNHSKRGIMAAEIVELYENRRLPISRTTASKLLNGIAWSGQLEKVGKGRWKYVYGPEKK